MRLRHFIAGFLIANAMLLSSPLMATILMKDAIFFDIGKTRVRSHITINGQEARVTRYYTKPYEGGSSQIAFRTEDRATYLLNCDDQTVALLNFVVLKPRNRVYEQAIPEYKPAHGPEMITAFKRVCDIELSDTRLMHPDFWFGVKAQALDSLTEPITRVPLARL